MLSYIISGLHMLLFLRENLLGENQKKMTNCRNYSKYLTICIDLNQKKVFKFHILDFLNDNISNLKKLLDLQEMKIDEIV